MKDFRACYGARLVDEDGGVWIDSASADALDVKEGDTVWSVACAAIGDLAELASEAERTAQRLAEAKDPTEHEELSERYEE